VDLTQAIVYGLVQGLTEFLPVSSSGHLLLVPALLHWPDPGAGFTAVIQLGTVLAVLIYFRTDLARAITGWWRSLFDKSLRGTNEARLGWAVFVGTIPVVIVGVLLEDKIDTAFRSALLVAGMLIGVALVMWIAEAVAKRTRVLDDVRMKDGLIVGLWQALALVPGASRSGSTIAGALFLGMDRATAARFSFLLSVPSVLASGLYKLAKDREVLFADGAAPTIVATVVAFASGYAAIAFLIAFLQKRSTAVFIGYRLVLGCAIIALALAGIIE
jgi:undecaprenyl-diphosphatase